MTSRYEPVLNPKELFDVLTVFIPKHLPIMILGNPGQGKTEIVRQASAACSADFVPIFLAIKDPTDIAGFPGIIENEKGEKEALFLPFGDMKKLLTAQKLTVCFADDVGPATKLMQASWMQAVCEREINGHKISPHVVFISASNMKGGQTGVTTILDPLMNKHTTVVQLESEMNSWCRWAVEDAKLPYEIVYFVRWCPEVLNAYEAMTDLSQTPTARGIEHCAQIYMTGINGNVRGKLFAGSIGTEYAAKLEGFLKFYKDLPNPDDVIADPKNAPIPSEPGQLWALCSALSNRASETTIDAIVTYANRLSKKRDAGEEFSVALVCDSVRRDREKIATGDAFIDWTIKHADILI